MMERYLVITFILWLSFIVLARFWNVKIDSIPFDKIDDNYRWLQLIGWVIHIGIGLFSGVLFCLIIYSQFIWK